MKVLRQANAGAAAARNTGLRAAGGEYLAFLDGDDRWSEELLARLVDAIRCDPALDLVFPQWRYIDVDGHPIGNTSETKAHRYSIADLMIANPIHSATGVLVQRRSSEAAGSFDETLTACIDLDYWLRIADGRKDTIGTVPAVLADYRKRPGQITADWRRMEHNWTRVLEKMRAAGNGLSAAEWRKGRARNCLYWATIAYDSGDYGAARRLIAETWRRNPGFAASDRLAVIRTLACCASLLPTSLHHILRAKFDAR